MSHHLNIAALSDQDQFQVLFRNEYSRLVHFAHRYVGDQEIAENIVQDVFYTLWKSSEQIELKFSVEAYLTGCVRNAALNHIKREQMKQKHHDVIAYESESLQANNPLEYEELQNRINEALAALPEKCREVFMLSKFEQKKYKEIAEELGISIKTVENQMGKALKHLRLHLDDLLIFLIIFEVSHRGEWLFNCLIS